MPRVVYGFVHGDCARELMRDRVARPVRCLGAGRIAALDGPASLCPPFQNGVRRILSDLRSYHAVLEDIMRRVPVLPARFGSRLRGSATLVRLVRDHEDELEHAISSYGHLRQADIHVTGSRQHQGEWLPLGTLRRRIGLELANFCLAIQQGKAGSGGLLMRLTVLFRPLDEPRLDAALARLDGEFGGRLHFACIGPLPPCTFARVVLSRSDRRQSGGAPWALTVDTGTNGCDLPLIPEAEPVSGNRAA